MLRSIFSRLVITHVLVAAFAVTAAGILSYRLFSEHYVTAQEEELVRLGRAVSNLAAPMLSDDAYRSEVSTVARTASAAVDGRVCIFGMTEDELLAAAGEEEGGDESHPAAVYRMLPGDVQVERTSAECEPRQNWTVRMPVNSASGRIGSVLVRAPVEGTESILRRVRRLTLGTAGGVGILAFLLSLALSRTITSPLRRITQATTRIGHGSFDTRIEPVPTGEVGEVAVTINEMAGKLEQMEMMRRSFVANASHQLRTPLTGARGFVEALADGTASTPEAQGRCASMALAELGRMQTLIEKLMDLSRYDAGAVELEPEPVEVGELVRGATGAFETSLAEVHVTLDLQLPGSLPTIVADGTRVVEALGNLIDNAARVMPEGGAITVSAERRGGFVRLCVADEGPGVPGEDKETVWERFYSKARLGEEPGGLGLGLAIVREIAGAHGGQTFLEEAPGGGAVFGFTLPIEGPKSS